jgi:hypothetical protein
MEDRIREALVGLFDAIRRADGDAVAAATGSLDRYLDQGRGALHPQLVHFLERRSYAKALMFLGGSPDIPAGSCGGT